ncbi:MAG: hypothetical protein F4Z85_12815, partial [Gemmatimonadetes bacterium]|nr:hypothetical protein [Gemmatimonadota bacterium]
MFDEKTQSTGSRKDTRWTSLIEELNKWPSEAPEWEAVQVQEFIDQVQLIAEQKGREREESRRFQLQQALNQLRENHGAILVDYFQCTDLSKWKVACYPMDRIGELMERLKDLLALLDQRQALYKQVPQNYLEGIKQWTALGDVERQSRAQVEQLDQDFSIASPELPRALDEDNKEDAQPSPELESTSPGQGPSSDSPDSDQEQKTKKDLSLSTAVVPKKEFSPTEKESESEPVPLSEEHEPTHIQTVLPEPKPLSLRSVQEVASLLQEDESDENWESLGWSLLAEDDLAGAYWLACSLKAAGRNVPVSPELLAVIQASRWLENDTDSLAFDIRQIVSEWEWGNQGTTSERLLSLAASLRPSLVAQHTGLVSWLPQREEVNPVLGTLVEAVRTFASAGHSLQSEDMRSVEGGKTHEEQIRAIGEQARLFLENNRSSRLKFKGATAVLRRLVSQEGDLHCLLAPVIKNKADQVAQVQQRIGYLGERRQICERIRRIDQGQGPRRSKPITGDPINQLVRSVAEAVGLARKWCELIKQKQDIHRTRRVEDVEGLRGRVQEVLPEVKAKLEPRQDQPQEEAAVGHILQRAIGQVAGMLGLEEQADIEVPETWMQCGSSSLAGALSRRLLYIPEISIDEDGLPEEEQEAVIAGYLRQSLAEKRSLAMAWDLRIEGQDFRFTNVLRNMLENDADRQRLEHRNDEELKSAQAMLKDTVSSVEGAIEKGLVDGLISEEERADLNAGLPRVEGALYLPPLLQQLSDIEERLNQRLEERLQELEVQWQEIKQGLEQSIPDLTIAEESIKSAFMQRDTRVIEESLAHLREVRDGERQWPDEWFIRPDKPDIFLKFQEARPRIEEALSRLVSVAQLAEMIEQGQAWADMEFGELPQECREETARALRSWHQLKRCSQQRKSQMHIQALLEYLGFRPSAGKSAVGIAVKKCDQDWLYCQVDAAVGDLARSIPQLGSQASGCYNVVCFWKRPRVASIGTFLRELGLDNQTVIACSLERLSEQWRCNMAAQAQENRLALVVLDEILLVFLARLDDTRLPTFLRCSLPYAALNPYMPFQAGNVPPEMYYGRDEMIRQLKEASCIVFGGRQLGKSSLLRQVEREFHQPESKQYAWIEDIKLVGDILTGEQPDRLWIKLRDGFKSHFLIRATEANQPERIRKYIEKAMAESPQRRVLV